MPKKLNEVITEVIRHYQLIPASCDQPDNCCGRCYQPLPEHGCGRIWFYEDGPYLGMLLINAEFRHPVNIESFGYRFLAYYDSVAGVLENEGRTENLLPYTLYTNESVLGEIRMEFHADANIKGLWILMDPQLGLKDLAGDLFTHVDLGRLMGIRFIPHVPSVIAQIEKCPINNATEISSYYYHCKIRELLSIYAGVLEQKGKEPSQIRTEDHEQIFMLQQYIRNHLDENCSLDDLAKMTHMSKSKLKYTFKTVANCTVGEYRDEIRLKTAASMLQETDAPIETISRALGFSTASSFSRFFRNRMGITPNQFRKHRLQREKSFSVQQ